MKLMRPLEFFGAALLAVILAGCSEPTNTDRPKEAVKPPEALTGRQAFQRVYPQARGWASDAQPLLVRSIRLQQVAAESGKSGAWEITMVSASLGKSKTYTYSAIEAEGNLHEGVFGGQEDSYSGGRGPQFPFSIAAIKVDSDEAYKTAAEKSEDYMKKHPDMPISFVLEQTNRFPDLTWRVIWGDSASASDYSVFVDASTGKFLQKAH
jgi:hypothetical protein